MVVMGCYSELSAPGDLHHQEEYDVHVDGFFFLTLWSTWNNFSVYLLTHIYTFALSSLICSSTLHPNLLRIVAFTYCFVVLLVPPKMVFLMYSIWLHMNMIWYKKNKCASIWALSTCAIRSYNSVSFLLFIFQVTYSHFDKTIHIC